MIVDQSVLVSTAPFDQFEVVSLDFIQEVVYQGVNNDFLSLFQVFQHSFPIFLHLGGFGYHGVNDFEFLFGAREVG